MASSSYTPRQDAPSASRILSLTLVGGDGEPSTKKVRLADVDRLVPVIRRTFNENGVGDSVKETPIIKVYMKNRFENRGQYLLAKHVNVLWQ